MITEEKFKELFYSQLKPILRNLDSKRVRILFRFVVTFLITLLILLSYIVLVSVFEEEFLGAFDYSPVPLIISFIFIVILIVFLWIYFGKAYKRYKMSFKDQIVRPLINTINPELVYYPENYITEGTFKSSRIFRDHYNRYSGDDHVTGSVGKTVIEFSELHVARVQQSGKQTQTIPIFDGIFFCADFNKNFKGETYVLPDYAEKWFGAIGRFLQKGSIKYGKVVRMENVDFEKEFAVYSTDQVEARYILSTSLMERILNLKKKFRKKIHISFVSSNLYIAITFFGRLLEPTLFRRLDNYKINKSYFDLIKSLNDIVEDLNLNTRIWTKQ